MPVEMSFEPAISRREHTQMDSALNEQDVTRLHQHSSVCARSPPPYVIAPGCFRMPLHTSARYLHEQASSQPQPHTHKAFISARFQQ